jgi:hypothetical protein
MLHRFSFEPVRDNCPFEVWTGYPESLQMELFEEAAEEI